MKSSNSEVSHIIRSLGLTEEQRNLIRSNFVRNDIECDLLTYDSVLEWFDISEELGVTHPELRSAMENATCEEQYAIALLYVAESASYVETFSISRLVEFNRVYARVAYTVSEALQQTWCSVNSKVQRTLTHEEKTALITKMPYDFSRLSWSDVDVDNDELFDFMVRDADNRAHKLVLDTWGKEERYVFSDRVQTFEDECLREEAVVFSVGSLYPNLPIATLEDWQRFKASRTLANKLGTKLSAKQNRNLVKM